jgi:hypothetical protein
MNEQQNVSLFRTIKVPEFVMPRPAGAADEDRKEAMKSTRYELRFKYTRSVKTSTGNVVAPSEIESAPKKSPEM